MVNYFCNTKNSQYAALHRKKKELIAKNLNIRLNKTLIANTRLIK